MYRFFFLIFSCMFYVCLCESKWVIECMYSIRWTDGGFNYLKLILILIRLIKSKSDFSIGTLSAWLSFHLCLFQWLLQIRIHVIKIIIFNGKAPVFGWCMYCSVCVCVLVKEEDMCLWIFLGVFMCCRCFVRREKRGRNHCWVAHSSVQLIKVWDFFVLLLVCLANLICNQSKICTKQYASGFLVVCISLIRFPTSLFIFNIFW